MSSGVQWEQDWKFLGLLVFPYSSISLAFNNWEENLLERTLEEDVVTWNYIWSNVLFHLAGTVLYGISCKGIA